MEDHLEIARGLLKVSETATERVQTMDIGWALTTEPHLGCLMVRGTGFVSAVSWDPMTDF
jgi:hypothetical protein